jgi:CBS domain containing-hemolysin-like protein
VNPGALAATLVLLTVNAYFVVAEFALVASRSARLEVLAGPGSRRFASAAALLRDVQRSLAASQLGITVASLGIGYLAEPAVADVIGPVLARIGDPPSGLVRSVSLVVALVVVAAVHLVLAELVPRNVTIAGPERALLAVAPVHRVIVRVLSPLVWLLNGTANAVLRVARVRPTTELAASVHTASELGMLVDASHQEGLLAEFEHSLLSGALDFRVRTAASVMVPRDAVVTVDRRMTIREIEQLALSSGHSRLPVRGAGRDEVLGFVHVKDLLQLTAEASDDVLPVELVRRMLVVRPDRGLEDLLRTMRRMRTHVVLVRDQGRVLGIVTLEDVLEALVGEITDETDRPASGVSPAPPTRGARGARARRRRPS